jgi:hypothetical protein
LEKAERTRTDKTWSYTVEEKATKADVTEKTVETVKKKEEETETWKDLKLPTVTIYRSHLDSTVLWSCEADGTGVVKNKTLPQVLHVSRLTAD